MSRKEDVLRFIKHNQPCSTDSIFTKGKIPKSVHTLEELNKLVLEKQVKTIISENGKTRYYVSFQTMNSTDKFKLVTLFSNQIVANLKKARFSKDIAERYSKLLKLRLRIFQIELKNLKSKNQLSIEGMNQITRRIKKLMSNPSRSISEISWLDAQIRRDQYYLSHQLRGLSVNSKLYDQTLRNRVSTTTTWKPKNRAFQPVKQARKMRSVTEKLEISDDRHSHGLSRSNQLYHNETLQSKKKDPTEKYDEIIKRANAEQDRILIKNMDSLPNQILVRVCMERIQTIKKDHTKSQNYRSEIKNLHNAIKQLEDNSTWLVDEWKKIEYDT